MEGRSWAENELHFHALVSESRPFFLLQGSMSARGAPTSQWGDLGNMKVHKSRLERARDDAKKENDRGAVLKQAAAK